MRKWLIRRQERDKAPMCGRYMVVSSPEAIRRLFGYLEQPNFPPRYNVAPTQPVPIARMVEGRRRFALVRWGLIPAWVKDPRRFSLLITGRNVFRRPLPPFCPPFPALRCVGGLQLLALGPCVSPPVSGLCEIRFCRRIRTISKCCQSCRPAMAGAQRLIPAFPGCCIAAMLNHRK